MQSLLILILTLAGLGAMLILAKGASSYRPKGRK